MPIVPDEKDWTWVLERACPECGFATTDVDRDDLAGRIATTSAAWAAILAAPDVRERPDDATWSPLEYACHVRDVFRLYDQRLVLMLTQDDPLYPDWDQDATAVAERYGEQDPAAVATQLADAGEQLASRLGGVNGERWERPGRRSDGARFSVETSARYLLHDPVHHLHDVGRAS